MPHNVDEIMNILFHANVARAGFAMSENVECVWLCINILCFSTSTGGGDRCTFLTYRNIGNNGNTTAVEHTHIKYTTVLSDKWDINSKYKAY